MKKTILILSGGMDSATLLYSLKERRKEVKAISFDYGQKHKKELLAAKKLCDKLGVDHKIIKLDAIKELISNSALTGKTEIPEGHFEDESMKLTVVPNRNMIMLSIAIGYAVNLDFDEVAIGVHAGDHQIYPDCRAMFINRMHEVARIANFKPISIYAPFIGLSKGDILRLGKGLNVDYSLTWTCYKGKDKPCGKCGSCTERAEAFEMNNIKDPLIKK